MSDIQSQTQSNIQVTRQVVKRPVKRSNIPTTEQVNSQRPYYEFPDQKKEKELDLFSIFYEVLSHYRSIILVTIIGMVIGAFIGFMDYQRKEHFVPSEYELARIKRANTLLRKYKASMGGRNDNYITSLDASKNDYVQRTMTYYIHMNDDNYIDMSATIFNLESNSSYIDELQSITGFTGAPNTLSSILKTSVQIINNENNSTVLFNTDSESSNSIRLKENYAVLTVTITYLTKEQCDQFSTYIEKNISTIISDNKNVYPGIEAVKISDGELAITSSFISNAITSLKEEEFEIITEYNTLMEEMSSNELFYYNINYFPNEASSQFHFIIKYMVIISMGVFALLVATYVLRFITSGIVVNEQELLSEYGLSIIGRVRIRPTKKGLAEKFRRKIHENSTDDCEPEYITNVLGIYNPAKIYMIATDADLYYIKEDTIPTFIEALSEVSTVPIRSSSLVTDSRIVRAAKTSAGVCVIVIPGVTKNDELRAQLAVCNKHKIFVQGFVILR